jgi:hypothetical protein
MGSVRENCSQTKAHVSRADPFGDAQSGKEAMTEILFAIQKRSIAQGIDPYVSNYSNA